MTFVVAIHQPRPELWQLFTHAILISRGRKVYCGPAEGALAGTARYGRVETARYGRVEAFSQTRIPNTTDGGSYAAGELQSKKHARYSDYVVRVIP